MIDLETKAEYQGKKLKEGHFPFNFHGHALDSLEIKTTIRSYEDIDKLMIFLSVHRPSFILTKEQIQGAYKNQEEIQKNGL